MPDESTVAQSHNEPQMRLPRADPPAAQELLEGEVMSQGPWHSSTTKRIVFVLALTPMIFASLLLIGVWSVSMGEVGDWDAWVTPWYATLAQEVVYRPMSLLASLLGDEAADFLHTSFGARLFYIGYSFLLAAMLCTLWSRFSIPPWERGWRTIRRTLLILAVIVAGAGIALAIWSGSRHHNQLYEVRGTGSSMHEEVSRRV